MRKYILLTSALLLALSGFAQQFRISEYLDGNITIEYPPSFDGAYLFIDQSTNLAANVWDTVDYSTVSLVQGETVLYSPLEESSSGESNNPPTEVPYEITPEYITAVANGEIENSEWAASTVWNSVREGASGFYRIFALSFVDSDGDGIDNVTEYEAGTDPYTNDAPVIALPADDGDPQSVPGSVDSAPGDWNTSPQNLYQATGSPYEAINMRILAMDGTNGTFTTETPVATLGTWIATQCGTWTATASGDLYPTVSGGRFYRTPKDGFWWAGKEHVFALALNAYDGSEAFVNHLVQASPSDPAGLALLSDGTPVLVDASNLWTEEKLSACLKYLITVECRLQQLSGGAFDPSDTTAMAQVQMEKTSGGTFYPLAPTDRLWSPVNYYKAVWEYDFGLYQWFEVGGSYWFARNEQFTFLDNLQAHGFGPTEHRGYVIIPPEEGWHQTGTWDYETYTYLTNMPPRIFPGAVSETFIRSDGESAWFMADGTNYTDITYRQRGEPSNSWNYTLTHKRGFLPSFYTVLSTLDPPTSSGQTLVMDMDRDGTIGTNDWNRVDESHPYRFWVNCDADDRNGTKYDLPASVTPLPVSFYRKDNYFSDVPGQDFDITESPNSIETLNDLEDFFPAIIQWPEGVASNATVKLFSNVKVGVVDAQLDAADSDQYLTDLTSANAILAKTVHVVDPLNSGSEYTVPSTSLDKAMLIEVHEENTNAMIWLTFDEGGGQTTSFTNYFSFTSVEKMFRYKNLRQGDRAAAPDRLDEPENRPDELCNDANFYYVHGFNVSEPRGRASQANMFKRLFWSGSNARFYGVSWDGNPLGTDLPIFDTPCHYHNAVVNSFASAPQLATFLNSQTAGGRKNILMAHSLGNIISSTAICNHGADVDQYYLIDAAVAKEAYGDVTPNENMIPDGSLIHNSNEGFMSYVGYNWHKYPFETYASEYYQLFDDVRTNLTWRHRFADVQTHTDAFNFYSSTEDVLRVDEGYTTLFSGPLDWDIWNATERFGLYAFQLQEIFKGKSDFGADAGGGSDPYTGWGFTTESDTHIVSTPLLDIDLWPKNPSFQHGQLSTNNPTQRAAFLETLKTDPLFRPEPAELFGLGGAAFAGATIGTSGFTFNYDINNATMNISNLPVRDYLLAKAFPARTGALGSRSNNHTTWEDANFDMHSLFMTDPDEWPTKDGGNPEWRHSAIRDLPYVHNYKLFDKLNGKERN